jgi:hypothetical protein
MSGGLPRTIGGLGANFSGTVEPKDAHVCCALSFGIAHASPADLFATLGPGARATPALVSSDYAKPIDLRQFTGNYGVLSTGDWTLTATMENATTGRLIDAAILGILGSWHLRPTPNGAILEVPHGSAVNYALVVLGQDPNASAHGVELTDNSEPCRTKRDTVRAVRDASYGTVGYWCAGGISVSVDGTRSYVESVVANLHVVVTREQRAP